MGVADDEIPEIDAGMLHQQRAEFEAGMGFFPPVTIALSILCALAFAAELAKGALDSEQSILDAGAMNAAKVEAGEVWRMGSAMFLHGGPDHLIGNLIVLYVLGMAAEHAYGRSQFLVLYVFSGLCGSAFSMIGGQTSVGASGAVFGVAGGMVAFFARHHRTFRVRDTRIAIVLVVWSVYIFGLGVLNPLVDNWCHLGGLLGGLAIGALMDRRMEGGHGGDLSRPVQAVALLAAIAFLAYVAVNFVPRLVK